MLPIKILLRDIKIGAQRDAVASGARNQLSHPSLYWKEHKATYEQ